MSEARDSQENFIIGRANLKVPYIPDEVYTPVAFLKGYFESLWDLNGFDVRTELPYNGREIPKRSFDYELVLPPNADKPLTVLRASNRPRDPEGIRVDRIRHENDRHAIIPRGASEFSVSVPPDELGPFSTVFKYTNDPGIEGFDLEVLGDITGGEKAKNEAQEAYRQEYPNDWDGVHEVKRTAYDNFLRKVLAETVDWLV